MDSLQGAVGTAPPCIISLVLHASIAAEPTQKDQDTPYVDVGLVLGYRGRRHVAHPSTCLVRPLLSSLQKQVLIQQSVLLPSLLRHAEPQSHVQELARDAHR